MKESRSGQWADKTSWDDNEYTEWDYEKKSCPKCADGVIVEEEGGTIIMAD